MVHTSNLNDGYSVVQNEINRLHDLAASRGYRFSPTKTCCVHFCRLRSVHVDPHLTLNGHYIAVRPTVKLLGIVFDCKLNWKDHIDHLVIRCRKVLNLIKCMARIRWGVDREILIRIYQALIESRLSYASIVYGSARRSKIKELERLQLAAVRAATGAFRTSPTVAVLCEASIMPLHLKIGQQTLMYEAKIKHLPHHINSVMFNYTNEFAERPSATRPARVRSLEFAEKCVTLLCGHRELTLWHEVRGRIDQFSDGRHQSIGISHDAAQPLRHLQKGIGLISSECEGLQVSQNSINFLITINCNPKKIQFCCDWILTAMSQINLHQSNFSENYCRRLSASNRMGNLRKWLCEKLDSS
nr:unnamed protein product [Callosobruchus chinensis]